MLSLSKDPDQKLYKMRPHWNRLILIGIQNTGDPESILIFYLPCKTGGTWVGCSRQQ